MAPTISKPSRPSFSPPRPAKSKVTKSSKDKAAVRRKPNGAIETGESSTSRAQKSKSRAKTTQNEAGKEKGTSKRSSSGRKKKQRGAGGTMRAFLDEEASATEEEEDEEDVPHRRARKPREPEDGGVLNEYAESMGTDESTVDEHRSKRKQRGDPSHDSGEDDEEDEDEEEEPSNDEETAALDKRDLSSPEPDFILAEITHPSHSSSTTSSEYAIPLPLLHRIMHASFTSPDRTTLASDARSLVGKYMEIFVKEAVRRCVDEKKERVAQGAEGDTGWLEVEDLERVGGQLVLDF
ncbi:hypothetical protein H2200_009856 [Cladophialophora chaetospira]|uniref:Uncharacterized protein n=1 Tax=Cladophialophora chaetospira TaxID=386627 RepID=A0AA39CF98_9EURO|nr:hypothetical protein H2200_009856 [Cladophialophora chaetospira]